MPRSTAFIHNKYTIKLIDKTLSIAIALILFLWISTGWSTPVFPGLTGRVVDKAELLSLEQESNLSAKLLALEAASSSQLVVVTLPDLQGYDIAQFAITLARHWKIGQAEKDNGALLVIAVKERKIRIEVGYGLEGVLTDATSASIIRNEIQPAFRNGNYDSGINHGIDAIIATIKGTYAGKIYSSKNSHLDDVKGYLPLLFIALIGFSEFLKRQFSRKISAGVSFGGIVGLVIFVATNSILFGLFAGIAAFLFAYLTGGGAGPSSGIGYNNNHAGNSSGGGFSHGGGFSGGGGSFGGGGASGGW